MSGSDIGHPELFQVVHHDAGGSPRLKNAHKFKQKDKRHADEVGMHAAEKPTMLAGMPLVQQKARGREPHSWAWIRVRDVDSASLRGLVRLHIDRVGSICLSPPPRCVPEIESS